MTARQFRATGKGFEILDRHTPPGIAWIAWRMTGKKAFDLWNAFAGLLNDAWAWFAGAIPETSPYTTTQLIGEWERAVSLPDGCLPSAVTLDERRQQVQFRLTKRRWTTAQDWIDLCALFGVRIAVVPGWIVQKPALYAATYPKRYDLFPKLGRFRAYIDVLDVNFGGYDYGAEGRGDGYPVPYGLDVEAMERVICILDKVKPANVVLVWNAFPDTYECYGHNTFDDTYSEEFC